MREVFLSRSRENRLKTLLRLCRELFAKRQIFNKVGLPRTTSRRRT